MSFVRMITSSTLKLTLRRQLKRFKRFHTSTTEVTGLYGFQHLNTAKGLERFVDEAIQRSNDLIDYVAQMPPSTEIIRAIDEIYDTVNTVDNSANMCISTHPDREFVEEANKHGARMDAYILYLDTNHILYNAIVKAEKDGHLLSKEAQMTAHRLRLRFERRGIHLNTHNREKVYVLNSYISDLSRQFDANIIADPPCLHVFPASRIPKILHHLVKPKPIYRTISIQSQRSLKLSQQVTKQKGFQILGESALAFVVQYASDPDVRRMAYLERNSGVCANLDVLSDLIAARHELAQIMGHKSYAEFNISLNNSPEVVNSFLVEMSELVRSKAEREFREIWEFKKEKGDQMSGDVEPWDQTYFMHLMESSICDVALESYFSLGQCIEGLKMVSESLFGITFHSIPLAPGESWHSDVLKISFYHPEEGDLGFLYLDLFSRKGKYEECAHRSIRVGRRISETEYQLPINAIVCNFSAPMNSSSPKLDHFEVVSLFHEFGHAFHSLLSRANYHFSSAAMTFFDLLETPSKLFEYFAWDYRVLKRFAKHYSSGEVIPEKLVMSMNRAKNMFAATHLQLDIFYALVDQKLFGEPSSSYPMDTVAVVADLKRQYTNNKHVDGTHWHTTFPHFFDYGAHYYSYLYGLCLASTLWEKICKENPLSSTMGSAIRRKFLQHGTDKDPGSLLIDLAGNDVVRKGSNGIIIPSITSLCKELDLQN